MVVGRNAPSPTGFLHLGNLRTALVAWLAARLGDDDGGGRFLLRVEDIDGPRVVPGCEAEQLDDLRWLGLDWDGPVVRQSERGAIYREYLARLEAAGHVFWCTCSRRDIAEAASAPHGPEGPVYPGTCRDTDPAAQRRHPQGAAARLRVPAGERGFDDRILGRVTGDLARDGGDFVLQRRDGLWAYQFACALDDALQGVTQVVRGADLAASTHKQRHLHELLGLPAPREWWHVPLMNDAAGQRLAKRDRAESLAARRAAGSTPAQVVGELAASLGLVPPGTALTAADLLASLTTDRLLAACRAGPRP